MSNNSRDATPSIAGYEYQFLNFLSLIIDNINDNNNIYFKYEGHEDIDKYICNKLNSIIQIKYHYTTNNSNSNELFNPDNSKSGFFKVFKYYSDNYEELNNISQIIYHIGINDNNNLITDPIIFSEFIKTNNTLDFYDKIITNYPNWVYNEDLNIFESFMNKLKFEYVENISIKTQNDIIFSKIEQSYFNTTLNNNIKIEYKKHYLLSLLINYIQEIIYNNDENNNRKIEINKIKTYINAKIKNDYDENILIDEIIQKIDNNINSTIMKNTLINKLSEKLIYYKDLENLYKLLNKSINNKSLYKDLQYKIHNVSINIYTNLLNQNKLTDKNHIKTISNSISKILNDNRNTQKIHDDFKKLIIENKELLN
jgi:hypothetical protein